MATLLSQPPDFLEQWKKMLNMIIVILMLSGAYRDEVPFINEYISHCSHSVIVIKRV
jgi:hypothetical protein